MTGHGRPVCVDSDGLAIDLLADDLPLPTLLVAPVSDAVKQVHGDRVTDDLDRSQLWAIKGIAVDRAIVEILPLGSFTMDDVIQRVAAAGYAWGTTLL
jgi:hypothetical protein